MIENSKDSTRIRPLVLLFLLLLFFQPLYGDKGISLEVLPGGAVIMPASLLVSQQGFPDLKMRARYRTESFTLPIYYSYRLGYRFNAKSAVELELNHLKVLLDNNPPEIEDFSITHGFNQLWVNYSTIYKGFVFRAGAGAIIAHPESMVRGKRFDTTQGFMDKGYYLSGITSQISAQKKIFIGKHFFFSAETKVTAAFAQVKIADGFARLPVFSLNGLVGLGLEF